MFFGPTWTCLPYALFALKSLLFLWLIWRSKKAIRHLLSRNAYLAQVLHQRRVLHEQQILYEAEKSICSRIAEELHDNISYNLSLTKLSLMQIDAQNPALVSQHIQHALENVRLTMHQLAGLSRSFGYHQIDALGLNEALKNEVQRINALVSFELKLIFKGSTRLLNRKEDIAFFRIIQECVHNIIKHSGARNAFIALAYRSNHILLKIADDGKGLGNTSSTALTGTRSGINNLKRRVELMRGAFRIVSKPDKGTSLQFYIPITT